MNDRRPAPPNGPGRGRAAGSHRPLTAVLAAVLVTVGAACSTTSDAAGTDTAVGEPGAEGNAVFDPTTVHEVSVTFDEDDYEAMLATYADSGDKVWIEASVTIDGSTYEQVGLRLKGNSSLRGLAGGSGGRGGGPGATASTDAPEDLPWLIRLDEYVDGQTHQGYEDLVVRSNTSQTSLNEAVALTLLEEAGLASERAMATRFSVNGSDDVLRLVVEHPSDDAWYEANFDRDGALYKAESTGDWSYRGDDADAYEDVFDQEGGDDVADLSPLMELLEFVDGSSDEEFADELPERLDVDAFATYLAMMDLLDNFDDIDGPGNNAYLWWDADSGRFTVVPWDLNLAFGAMGGGRPAGGFDGEPPDDGELPEDLGPPTGGGFGAGRGGPGGGGNPLVERFLENEEFAALYAERTDELRAELFDSGVLDAAVAEWVEVLTAGAGDLVAAEVVESEAAAITGG